MLQCLSLSLSSFLCLPGYLYSHYSHSAAAARTLRHTREEKERRTSRSGKWNLQLPFLLLPLVLLQPLVLLLSSVSLAEWYTYPEAARPCA